ncbi:MAG: enoyl-CoA hydratase [Deltaproteobacteria bacterium]|nr:MAG: enoyl-CoA hydratase [Deltaproteobacteria bacterium]
MPADDVRVVDRDGVRWIELHRPESRNGLTVEVNKRIIEAVTAVESLAECRVVVLTGAGGHFCSGLDLKAILREGPVPPEQRDADLRDYFHGLIRAVRGCSRPTIAAVDGAAAGFGCDLALACDLRLVSDRARFGEIFVRRGLMPDGGSTFLLPRIVGLGRALEMMLTGELVDAREAHRIGLANRVYPADELHDAAWAFAIELAKGAPLSHRAVKRAVALSLESDFDAALDRERAYQLELLQSRDFMEGVTAFLQKRAPEFKGE